MFLVWFDGFGPKPSIGFGNARIVDVFITQTEQMVFLGWGQGDGSFGIGGVDGGFKHLNKLGQGHQGPQNCDGKNC